MTPTEPAAFASLPAPPRPFYEDKAVAFCFVVLASLGFACVASLFAEHARNSGGDVRGPAIATACVLALGAILEKCGASHAWALVTKALALAPFWAATLFFDFFWPDLPLGGFGVGAFLIALPVLAVVGGGRALEAAKATPRRSWVALTALALLWAIPFPSEPVDADDAPIVKIIAQR